MSGYVGTASLVRLAARRDRVLLPISVLALVGVVAASARATFDLYPDPATAVGAVQAVLDNPALVAVYGPMASATLDSFATFKTLLVGAVFLCLLAYVVVRRHTRTEEESGRLELVGAGVVGRRAPLAAAVLLSTMAVLLTGLLLAAASIAVGLHPGGSVAFAVSWLAVGLTWVGVTAVAAQLTETARGTAGFAIGALVVAYLLRALGDTAQADSPLRVLSWVSPLGWTGQVAPFGANRLWVGVLGLVAYAALLTIAFALLEQRDLGSGVLPSRPGPADGTLATLGDLTWRLARGTMLAWVVGFVVVGALVGSLAGNVQSFVDSPETAEMLQALGGGAGSIIDTFFATEMHVLAVVVSALGILLVTRMRGEETSGRAETLLATAATRLGWAGSHVVMALVCTAACVLAMSAVAGLVDAPRTGDVLGSLTSLVGAGLATLPAVWVCVGVAMLMVGLVPRLTGVVWGVLVAFLVVGEFGELIGLPDWVVTLSPFGHLPDLPGGRLEWAPLVGLTAVAALLLTTGLSAIRRRDLSPG